MLHLRRSKCHTAWRERSEGNSNVCNPVRIGWVGGTSGKRLRDYRWSSFLYYGGRKTPEWMVTERVLQRFELDEGIGGLYALPGAAGK